MTAAVYASAALWLLVLVLPWRPWSTRERIAASHGADIADLGHITVLLPARNEAESIAETLRSVAAQGAVAGIILVDDQSTDGTAERARGLSLPNLSVVTGARPPAGWSGKLWALAQGFAQVTTPYVLLLDADIALRPGILPALVEKLEREDRDMVSVMARLVMESWWEKLLIPPFIYFFKLLYPFALVNGRSRWVAAAAGGCILIKTDRLRGIGGFAALRDALIDDCTLARRVKQAGGRIWLGLSHDVRAIRPYGDLTTIWNMVARTAFTQLRYSFWLLVLCTALMGISFVMPVLGIAGGEPAVRAAAAVALLLMLTTYLPTVRYYRLCWIWLPTLPLAAGLYLAMTWTSAWRYWRGERSRWKDRIYDRASQQAQAPRAPGRGGIQE